MIRKLALGLLALLGGSAALLGIEIKLALGVERLEGFPLGRIGGRIGEGTDEPLRVAWLGDSTGSGVGASDLAHVLPRVVADGLGRPVDLLVTAVSGARAADVRAEQLPLLQAFRPDLVFLAVGGNDVVHATSRGRFRAEMDLLLKGIAEERPDRVVVLGIGEFGNTLLFKQPLRSLVGLRGHQLDEDVRGAAMRSGALYVDIVGLAGEEFMKDPARYHARDRFHPSDDGYRLWAEATLKTVRGAGW